MQLDQIKRKHKAKKARLVGRGGKRGKTSGRGTKGQKARAGHSIRPQSRDVMKRLPKQRGFKFPKIGVKPAVINVSDLEMHFESGNITPVMLAEKKLIKAEEGRLPTVKILGDGELKKKFIVSGLLVSKSAKEKIEKAGGEVKSGEVKSGEAKSGEVKINKPEKAPSKPSQEVKKVAPEKPAPESSQKTKAVKPKKTK